MEQGGMSLGAFHFANVAPRCPHSPLRKRHKDGGIVFTKWDILALSSIILRRRQLIVTLSISTIKRVEIIQ